MIAFALVLLGFLLGYMTSWGIHSGGTQLY